MKKLLLVSSLVISSIVLAHEESESNNLFHKSTINCGKDGCSVVCHEPGARWDTFLKSEGNIEVTYFFASGTKQLKADMGKGEFTILDTNPNYQSCRITGVVN